MNTVRIETLGCRLNQIESEAVANLFINSGFEVKTQAVSSSQNEDSDTVLCILNTCTVTQKAEQKARRIIRLMLKKYPLSCVVVTGCYAQLSENEINSLDKRIAVVRGQIKSRLSALPELLSQELIDEKVTGVGAGKSFDAEKFAALIKEALSKPGQEKNDFPEQSFKLSTSSFVSHSRASLKIQDGCNSTCSYCAIHMARGHSVSLDVETAIQRVKELEAKGHSEVVLTTVNIGQYKGKYKDGYCNFTKLLELLLQNTSTINFRISSLYPEIINEEFCRVISNKRVRAHFHISVQSGSNKILKSMNRNYEAEDVIKACRMLSQAKENPFLACDIITGFPGETDEDFEETMDLCRKCNFSWVHAFPFSERPGTVAAAMKNKVPQEISGKRAAEITKWAIEQKINYINLWKNKPLTAIIETSRNRLSPMLVQQKLYHAMTENFIHCEITTKACLEPNKEVKVKLTRPLEDRIRKGGDIEAAAEIIL